MRTIFLAGVGVVLAACGGSGGGGVTPPRVTYTLGGTVTGLNAAGLVLANGATTTTVGSGANNFSFAAPFNAGTSYTVSVSTQPAGQLCSVANGSGTFSANVSNVSVSCVTLLQAVSSNPADAATGVERNATPTIVFSAVLDPATVTPASVAFTRPASTSVTAAIGTTGTNLGVYPARKLLPATQYTLNVAASVRGTGGESLAGPVTRRFTTRDLNWSAGAALIASTTSDNSSAKLAFDGNGTALLTWQLYDGMGTSLWSNRYVPGEGWGTPTPAEQDDAGNANSHALAVDHAGNAVLVWQRYDGTRTDLWANRYTAATGWGTAGPIETDDTGDVANPDIAVDADGNAIAVWSQWDGVRANLWANRYVAGAGWGTAALIETDNAGDAELADVACAANGSCIAVWQQFDGTRENIWANRYVAGTGWGTAALIESDNAGRARLPKIAVDAAGNAIVVWPQHDGTRFNAWSNRFADGAWGTATLLETDDSGSTFEVTVAAAPGGNAIAIWLQEDATSASVRANRYVTGAGWGTAATVQPAMPGEAGKLSIALDPAGNGIAVWSGSSIMRVRFLADGGWTAPASLAGSQMSASGLAMSMDLNGDVMLFWSEIESFRYSVWWAHAD